MRLDDDLKYFESEEFKEVLAQYESMLEKGVSVYMDAEDLTDVAEFYAMVEHDEERASQAIDYALMLHPDAVDPQVFRARKLMLDGQLDEAEELCDAIADQRDREVAYLHAELMVRQQQAQQAEDYLLQKAEQVEEDMDYYLYDAAYIFVDYHEYEHAEHFAEKLEEIAPEWYKTFQLRADIFLGMDQYERALTYVESMLDRDPFSTEAWNWSAEAYCGMMNYEKALESTDYALAVEPDNVRALQLQAWAFLQQRNCEKAHELYERLKELDDTNELNWLYDSFCLYDMNRLPEAMEAVTTAEKMAEGMSQEQAAIYEQLAQVHSGLNQLDEAMHYLDEAWKVGAFERDVDMSLFKARIYAENHLPRKAQELIQRAVASSQLTKEETSLFLLHGAQLLFEEEHYALALNLFRQVKEQTTVGGGRAVAKAYVTLCLHNLGDHEAALNALDEALSEATEDSLEVLAPMFAEGVNRTDYYAYYYHFVRGVWPYEDA